MLNDLCAKLIENKITIASAESCTGGIVSSMLVSFAGISEVFLAGLVTYSNKSKMELLGVDAQIIEKYGAVSSECALAMAKGVRKVTGARCGISTTGIAGPTGAMQDKPVGLVYIAVCFDDKTKVEKLLLSGFRQEIMQEAAGRLLDMAESLI